MEPRSDIIRHIEAVMAASAVTVLTGIRRGGKSFLLHSIMERLRKRGVEDERIIYFDFEKFAFAPPRTMRELRLAIQKQVTDKDVYYLFLDEVDCASGWEKALSSFAGRDNVIMCIAASGTAFDKNTKKKIFGNKWSEVEISPFSYSEYKSIYGCSTYNNLPVNNEPRDVSSCGSLLRRVLFMQQDVQNDSHDALDNNTEQDVHNDFEGYIKRGGFPSTLNKDGIEPCGNFESQLNNIYTSIIYHDVMRRYNIANARLLERIVQYIFENLGGECPATKLAALFKREKYTKNLSTISSILKYIEAAHLVVRVRVVNLAKQKVQSAHSRYYAGDHALFWGVAPDAAGNTTAMRRPLCENILVTELKRRGYNVYTGRFYSHTVDFIAQNETQTICIQLFEQKDEEKTRRKKTEALNAINETFEASLPFLFYAITIDGYDRKRKKNGVIEYVSLPEFLTGG